MKIEEVKLEFSLLCLSIVNKLTVYVKDRSPDNVDIGVC